MSNSGPLSVPNGQGDPEMAARARARTAARAFAPGDRAPAVDLGAPPDPDANDTSPTDDLGARD